MLAGMLSQNAADPQIFIVARKRHIMIQTHVVFVYLLITYFTNVLTGICFTNYIFSSFSNFHVVILEIFLYGTITFLVAL